MRVAAGLLAAIVGLAGAMWATPASACVWTAVTCVGPGCPQTEAQRRAQARHWSGIETRRRSSQAHRRLRAGSVDFGAELAELLIPNVRPIYTDFSSCGPEGEIDHGAGRETQEYLFQRLAAGTPLAGANRAQYSPYIRQDGISSFGTPCNAEFRAGFAAYLRTRVDPLQLRRAWLFLGARQRERGLYGSLYHRLMSFQRDARTPPANWILADEWLYAEVLRFVERDAAGRAIAAAVQGFWIERGGSLGDDAAVCPAATSAWSAERERLVAGALAWEAARGRRAPQPSTRR